MTTRAPTQLSVVIPTYRRERVLVETVEQLLPMMQPGDELLVLDQTPVHEPETEAALARLATQGRIRWLRLPEPSIPKAMNRGLLEAVNPFVAFFDDDIRPEPGLLDAYRSGFEIDPDRLFAGRVVQPWDEGREFTSDSEHLYAGRRARPIEDFIGCNFAVPRDLALAIGGFDENFVRVAYRFEAEFAHRWRAAGRVIWFEPAATVHHLKVAAGGTRTYGEHLGTARPDHAVGEHYFALVTRSGFDRYALMLRRAVRSIVNRHHLRRPWRIPLTLWGECRAMCWALRLHRDGPRHADVGSAKGRAA